MTDIHSCSYYCTRPECVLAQRDELRDRLMKQAEPVSALIQYNEIRDEDPADDGGSPLERLRFFCSLAMSGQDWLDVEPFFDAVEKEQAEPVQAEPVVEKAEPDDASGNPSW